MQNIYPHINKYPTMFGVRQSYERKLDTCLSESDTKQTHINMDTVQFRFLHAAQVHNTKSNAGPNERVFILVLTCNVTIMYRTEYKDA